MYRTFFFAFVVAFIFLTGKTQAQFSLDAESGVTFSGYNDVKVPGYQGTFIALTDDLRPFPKIFYRLRLSYLLNDAHYFSALFAPLTLRAEGIYSRELFFLNTIFAPDAFLNVGYQFNSYRLTYRYIFPRTQRFQFGIGATAKIRDAAIEVQSNDKNVVKSNTGFVPMLNFMAEWVAKERLSFMLTGDVIAAPQGRAEDVLLAAYFYPYKNITLKMGYRILEGGVDSEEIYNFTLLHYAVIGGKVSF